SRYDATFLNELRATKVDGAIKVGDLRFYFPYPDQTFSAADETALKAANPQVEVIRFSQWAEKAPTPGNDKGFPMIKKFYDPNAQIPPAGAEGASSKDLFLFRLAETYFIAAEAYFKMGQLDKAAQKLNAISQRAAKAGQSLTITSADVTLDFILDEKAREMVGEYKRWLDLKRTRRLARVFEQNLLTKAANSGPVLDKYYLRPIPQSVIDRDTEGYPQNPGY
ncbi:MAG: RagB/SusD family nutrient uptake outer membrane protein, partial [Ferruginibacter sp.]